MATYCLRCHRGSWACACDLTFAQKIRTLHIDYAAMETRDKHNFYDAESIEGLFGDTSDALDATDGLGPGWVGVDGQHYHRDRHTKEPVRTTDEQMDQVYLGGRTEEHG